MQRTMRSTVLTLLLAGPLLVACGNSDGSQGPGLSPPRALAGEVSISARFGSEERTLHRIQGEAPFRLRYSRDFNGWYGRTDQVRIEVTGQQVIQRADGTTIVNPISGGSTLAGSLEINLGEDGDYYVRFSCEDIPYQIHADIVRQGLLGGIDTPWGVGPNPLPADGRHFSGRGVYLSPEEEGMRDRSRIELHWNFAPP